MRSMQHEAALIAMQSASAQVVPNVSAVLEQLEQLEANHSRPHVCPEDPVAAPAHDYMRHKCREKHAWCTSSHNGTGHPQAYVETAWPLWAPLEAALFGASGNSERIRAQLVKRAL